MANKPDRTGYLRQAWLVIFLALLYGAALAGAQTALGPRIARNRQQEAYRMIPTLVHVEGQPKIDEEVLTGEDGTPQRVYRVQDADAKLAGWVLEAHGQGFADRIDLLIGVTPDVSRITGLYVLDQKETPNLGALVIEPAFRDQFTEKLTDPPITIVTSTPTTTSQIEAVTGATISSLSVAEIVNRAIKNLKVPIQQAVASPEKTD